MHELIVDNRLGVTTPHYVMFVFPLQRETIRKQLDRGVILFMQAGFLMQKLVTTQCLRTQLCVVYTVSCYITKNCWSCSQESSLSSALPTGPQTTLFVQSPLANSTKHISLSVYSCKKLNENTCMDDHFVQTIVTH